MAVTRSRSVTTRSLPDDLYYLAPGFPADRLTVAEIKNILLKHHVSSENCNRKAEFVTLFKTKVLPKREKILKTREDAAEAAELAIHQNRFMGVEESSDNDTSAGTLETTGDSDDDEAAVTEKRGSSRWSTLLSPLRTPCHPLSPLPALPKHTRHPNSLLLRLRLDSGSSTLFSTLFYSLNPLPVRQSHAGHPNSLMSTLRLCSKPNPPPALTNHATHSKSLPSPLRPCPNYALCLSNLKNSAVVSKSLSTMFIKP